jgi:RNA polymerase sigma factor (sigma-70 family)
VSGYNGWGATRTLSDRGGRKSNRAYLPTVEALEALRLFSGAAAALPSVAAERGALPVPLEPIDRPGAEDAWDDALGQAGLVDLRGRARGEAGADAEAIDTGLARLGRYLSRAWYRAGIAMQQHDDCSQAVYATLLANLGRAGFDRLLAEVGRLDIREVFSRDTTEGPDFFRAIDMVKKQAQRQRRFESLDGSDVASSVDGRDASRQDWRETLEEAIAQTLNPREAALIHDTLDGKTPAQIALQWGVAPKTVSNEKTRALQKLREFLVAVLAD